MNLPSALTHASGGKVREWRKHTRASSVEIVEWRVDETSLKQGKREGGRLMICKLQPVEVYGEGLQLFARRQ